MTSITDPWTIAHVRRELVSSLLLLMETAGERGQCGICGETVRDRDPVIVSEYGPVCFDARHTDTELVSVCAEVVPGTWAVVLLADVPIHVTTDPDVDPIADAITSIYGPEERV